MNTQQVICGPAQRVGNMRFSRKPFKRSVKQSGDTNKGEGSHSDFYYTDSENENVESDTNIELENQIDDEEEKMGELYTRKFQDRKAREMQVHVASRQPDISNNPGSNAKQIFNSNPQQRGLSH